MSRFLYDQQVAEDGSIKNSAPPSRAPSAAAIRHPATPDIELVTTATASSNKYNRQGAGSRNSERDLEQQIAAAAAEAEAEDATLVVRTDVLEV